MDDPRAANTRLSVEFARAKQEEQDRISFSREEGGLPDFHVATLEEIGRIFTVPEVDVGLTDSDVSNTRRTYGPNVISPPRKNPIWMWLGFIFGGFNGFLWFAAAVSWLAWALGYLVRFCELNQKCRQVQKAPFFSFSEYGAGLL